MTCTVLYHRPLEAHAVVDSIFFRADGSPDRYGSKFAILHHAKTLVVLLGMDRPARRFEELLSLQPALEDVDDVMAVAPELLRQAFDEWKDEFAEHFDHLFGDDAQIEAFILGWSEQDRTFRGATVATFADYVPKPMMIDQPLAGPPIVGATRTKRRLDMPADLIAYARKQKEQHPGQCGGDLFHIAMRPKLITVGRCYSFPDRDEQLELIRALADDEGAGGDVEVLEQETEPVQ